MNELNNVTNSDLYREIVANRNEFKTSLQALETRLLFTIEGLNRKIRQLEVENSELNDKVEKLDRDARKTNLVVFGLKPSKDGNLIDETLGEIKKYTGVDVQVGELKNLYGLGKNVNKPILIEFQTYFKRNEVLRNSNKLKGTGIRISKDLTLKQRREEYILREHLKLARLEENNKCMIRGSRLIVNGTSYTAADLEGGKYSAIAEEDAPKSASAPGTRRRKTYQQN